MKNISNDKPERQPSADADDVQRMLDVANFRREHYGLKPLVRGEQGAEALIRDYLEEKAKLRRQMERWKRSHERGGR